MDVRDISIELLAIQVELLAHRISQMYPPLPPSINHDKSSSIMENRLLPHEDKQELRQRFYALKQGKRVVAEYIVEFDDMRKKCGFKKASENTIAWFLRGLSRKIAKEVELKKHETLEGVYKYAIKVERKRALAKMTNSKPCTTMEQNAKKGISDAEKESTKPNVSPPPPPPPPPMSHDMPSPLLKQELPPPSHMNQDVPPPPKHELPPPSLKNQDVPPTPKCELPPPPSSPTHKLQPHDEEDSGLSNELSKDVKVCGEKGRHKGDGDRVLRVRIGDREKLKPFELMMWFREHRWEIHLFKIGNFLRLRWENLKRVKMKELENYLTNNFSLFFCLCFCF